jgi:hypothetical protein
MNEEQKAQSILYMARGAISERVDYEMGKVLENINDPNTEANKPRVIALKLTFLPSPDRGIIQVKAEAQVKLQPTTAVQTTLGTTFDPATGKMRFAEMMASEAPGQMLLFGGEEETPELRFVESVK